MNAATFICWGLHVFAGLRPDENTLAALRKLYLQASSKQASCSSIINKVTALSTHDPVLLGYKAAATMVMANHVFNPLTKLSHFNQGRKELDALLKVNALNHELRYLRLSIQLNAPSFLGYSGQIAEDKTYLKGSLSKIKDDELKKMITDLLSKTKNLNPE